MSIRYKLCNDVKYLFPSIESKDKIAIPIPRRKEPIFCNILDNDVNCDFGWIKLRIYIDNGEFIDGYCRKEISPVAIHNDHELYDGRFNA